MRFKMRFKTPMLQSDLCDYSDKYIVVKESIIVTDPNVDAFDKKLAFKHLLAAFKKFIIHSIIMQKT